MRISSVRSRIFLQVKKKRQRFELKVHFVRPNRSPQILDGRQFPSSSCGATFALAPTILVMIGHADSGVLWKRSRGAIVNHHLPVITQFLLPSPPLSLSVPEVLGFVVTRAILCAHLSPQGSTNLAMLRSACPVIRFSLI